MTEAPRLRPLSLIEILDQAFRFYRRGFFTFLPILAVVYVPVSVALMAFYATHPEAFTSEDPRQAKLLESMQRLLDAAVSGFTISIAVGAITRAIGDMYLGEAPSFGRSYRALGGVLGGYVLTVLMADIAIVMGYFACVVPGIILSVFYAFSQSACILEGVRGPGALARSRRLGQGHGGRIFGMLMLFVLLDQVQNYAIQSVGEHALPLILSDEWTQWWVWNGLVLVAELLVSPFFAIAWVVLYYDLRIRKEGFDLEVLARTLSRRIEKPPPDV